MVEIPRDTFIAAIEAGIAESEELTEAAVEALRSVGREAKDVGRCGGQFFPGDPCCPAVQARLSDTEPGVLSFQLSYDHAIRPALKPYGGFVALCSAPARIVD